MKKLAVRYLSFSKVGELFFESFSKRIDQTASLVLTVRNSILSYLILLTEDSLAVSFKGEIPHNYKKSKGEIPHN